jgi:hypothetical protein
MATYDEAEAKSFADATTTTITGLPLDVYEDHPLRQARNQPIQVCVCVTDPCTCDKDPIIWVGESAVQTRAATGQQTKAGDELYDSRSMSTRRQVPAGLHGLRSYRLTRTRARVELRATALLSCDDVKPDAAGVGRSKDGHLRCAQMIRATGGVIR